MIRSATLALALAGTIASAASAQDATAPRYSASIVFGDSLSDQGNAAEFLGHNFPNPPSYHDSFTNGDVAVAVMSQRLGFVSNPSLFTNGFVDSNNLGLTPGNNYAFGGSTAGNGIGNPGANLSDQVGAYLFKSGGVASASALYTVFMGGNDVRTAAHSGVTGYVDSGVATELATITTLYNAGARNFLVVNVPDIGKIPEFQLGYPSQVAAASADTTSFNNGLSAGINKLGGVSPGATFTLFDLYGFSNNLMANPGAYGITNTTTPCYTSYTGITNAYTGYTTSAACGSIDPATGQPANINQLAFWDAIHPTATVHRAIGNAMADRILALPEPATWLSMIVGFAMVGAAMRRRERSVSALAA